MYSVLPRDVTTTYEALLMQKERLKAELANATYQAIKSKIEDGLEQLTELKIMIEKQIRILHESLDARKVKVERMNAQKERSILELNSLDMEIVKQERIRQDIIDSSVKQKQANKLLTKNLALIQNQCDTLSKQKATINEKIDNARRRLLTFADNIKHLQTKNTNQSVVLKQVEVKNRALTQTNVAIAYEIQQCLFTIDKIKADIVKIEDYNNKLKAVNSKVTSDCLNVQTEIHNNDRVLDDLQKQLHAAQVNLSHKITENRQNLVENQALEHENYKLYEQNKTLSLQQTSDQEVFNHLKEMNIRLKTLLNQKQIINKQTQSVLLLPRSSNHSKISTTSQVTSKILGSTGAGFV